MNLEDKRGLSIIGALLVFFLVGTTIVIAYNYLGKPETATTEGSLSIYFCTVYVRRENSAVISLLIANTGNTSLTVNSIKIGEEVCELPVEGMVGTNEIKVGVRSAMEIPLKGTYIIGGIYDFSIETDPPATYKPLQATVAPREW